MILRAHSLSEHGDALEEEVVEYFDRFRAPLLRYASSFGLSEHDAEDTIQDAYLALFRHLREGKDRDNLRGWLFRVTHNLALKRRMQNREAPERSDARAVDPGPDPEHRLSLNQNEERVRRVVAALPEQDRRCLFLRAEGLRYREISAALDMSLGAVSTSLARSLARIARSR